MYIFQVQISLSKQLQQILCRPKRLANPMNFLQISVSNTLSIISRCWLCLVTFNWSGTMTSSKVVRLLGEPITSLCVHFTSFLLAPTLDINPMPQATSAFTFKVIHDFNSTTFYLCEKIKKEKSLLTKTVPIYSLTS